MKDLNSLNDYRVTLLGDRGDSYNGAFKIPYLGKTYTIIASNGLGWEHVSISLPKEVPSWKAMCKMKDLFFHEEETVMQLHPPKSEYINNHKYCLHLWKPIGTEIPMPPSAMVGLKKLNFMGD